VSLVRELSGLVYEDIRPKGEWGQALSALSIGRLFPFALPAQSDEEPWREKPGSCAAMTYAHRARPNFKA